MSCIVSLALRYRIPSLLGVALATALLGGGCGSSGGKIEAVHGSIGGPSADRLQSARPVTISMVSPRLGFVARADGSVLGTSDGGHSWKQVGSVADVSQLDFFSAKDGFALTSKPELFSTADGGHSWQSVHAFMSGQKMQKVQFLDRSHGFAIGASKVYRSDDGGRSWRRLPFRSILEHTRGISFLDRWHGFVVGAHQVSKRQDYAELWATSDGGATWKQLAETYSANEYPTPRRGLPASPSNDLSFVNSRDGYLDTREGVYETTDGGRSWGPLATTFRGPDVIAASWFKDGRGIVIAGGNGLLETANDGRSWSQLYPGSIATPTAALSFSSARNGIGGGPMVTTRQFVFPLGRGVSYSSTGSTVLVTSDGGRTWQLHGYLPWEQASQLERISGSELWAVPGFDDYGIGLRLGTPLFHSIDNGRHWTETEPLTENGGSLLSFPTRRVGFLAFVANRAMATSDGGRHWSVRHWPGISLGTGFLSLKVGFLMEGANRARLLITRNDGKSWHRLPAAVETEVAAMSGGRYQFDYPAIKISRPNDAWIAGDVCAKDSRTCKGELLHSADAGKSWQLIKLPLALGGNGITSVDFVTASLGYMTNDSAGTTALYRTSDGGRSWHYAGEPIGDLAWRMPAPGGVEPLR